MKYSLKFIRNEYNTPLLVSEYTRLCLECGLFQSEKIILTKYLNKNMKILDLGCGAGRIYFGLYELGYHNVVGYDIAPNMIKSAKQIAKKKRVKSKFCCKDICKIKFYLEKFNAIIFSFNGLMCIPKESNRISAIKNINKILKKDGIFILTSHIMDKTENFVKYFNEQEKIWEKGKQNKDLLDFGDIENPDAFASYIHIAKHKEVKNLLNTNGFEIIDVISKNEITDEKNKKREHLGDFYYYICKKVM